MNWEVSRYNWAKLRAARSATHVPDAVAKLAGCASEQDAQHEYWRIDNTVVVQGAVYEAGVATVSIALLELASCTRHGLGPMLELISQLCCGSPADTEVDAGNARVVEACIAKLRAAECMVYSVAPRVDNASLWQYVDLLFTLVEVSAEPHLALWYAWSIAARFPDTDTARNVARWSLELQPPSGLPPVS